MAMTFIPVKVAVLSDLKVSLFCVEHCWWLNWYIRRNNNNSRLFYTEVQNLAYTSSRFL